MSGSSAISGQLLLFLALSPKVPTLDGWNVNWQPYLLRSASIFPETGSYILTKSIGTNALTCLGSLESPDSSLFFGPFWTIFWSGFGFFLKRKKFRNIALYGLRLVAPSQCGLFGQKKKVLSLTQLHVN